MSDTKGSRGPAAATRAAACPGSSVYCACQTKGSQEALCTAPATRKAAAGQRRPRAPQLLQEALCTAPATRQAAAGQRRPRAPQLFQEALCTAPATRKAAAGQRRPHAPQLLQEALCTARATRKAAAAPAEGEKWSSDNGK